MSKRCAVLVLVILLVGWRVCAQDGEKDLAEKKVVVVPVREIVAPTQRLTQRIVFVLDVSGSMQEDGKIKRLVGFVGSVIQQPLDELQIAIFAFDTSMYRWPGVADPPEDTKPVPKGWAKLPSEEALKSAQAWLSQFTSGGGTRPEETLRAALSEERTDMSVVVVTDGDYNNGSAESTAIVAERQAWREKKGCGKAVIMAFGVGKGSAKQEHLAALGRTWLGGFYSDDVSLGEKLLLSDTAPVISTARRRTYR